MDLRARRGGGGGGFENTVKDWRLGVVIVPNAYVPTHVARRHARLSETDEHGGAVGGRQPQASADTLNFRYRLAVAISATSPWIPGNRISICIGVHVCHQRLNSRRRGEYRKRSDHRRSDNIENHYLLNTRCYMVAFPRRRAPAATALLFAPCTRRRLAHYRCWLRVERITCASSRYRI